MGVQHPEHLPGYATVGFLIFRTFHEVDVMHTCMPGPTHVYTKEPN